MTEFGGLVKAYLGGPHNAVTLKYKLSKMCSNLAFFLPNNDQTLFRMYAKRIIIQQNEVAKPEKK